MAKTVAKKIAEKKPAKEKKSDAKTSKGKLKVVRKTDENEGLSEFQETEKTGRAIKEKPKKKKGMLTITKVKLNKKDNLFIGFTVIENDGSSTTDSKQSDRVVHKDLKAVLTGFRVHLALLCDYLSTQQVKDIKKYNQELVDKFSVTGVSIGGNEGEEGIMITGYKSTRRKKTVPINSPFERFEEVAETRYKYMDELQKLLDKLMDEVKGYMDGSKVGEQPQGSFDFPEAEDGNGEDESNDNSEESKDDDSDSLPFGDDDE